MDLINIKSSGLSTGHRPIKSDKIMLKLRTSRMSSAGDKDNNINHCRRTALLTSGNLNLIADKLFLYFVPWTSKEHFLDIEKFREK